MLEHKIKRESVSQDGKGMVVVDTTVFTAEEPRSALALVLQVFLHDGTSEVVLEGASPLTKVANTDPPQYSDATAYTATHYYVPMPRDGYYTIKSALVPRREGLTGDALLGKVVADAAGKLARVLTATLADGVWSYTFEEDLPLEAAILDGNPAATYPAISLVELTNESDRLNLSYVLAGTQPVCAPRITSLRENGCSHGGPERTMLRNLYFDIVYQLTGAEISFEAGLKARVLSNLAEARFLVEQTQTLIGK